MSSDEKSLRLKRLHYRAWHRGTREMDLILGRFSDKNLQFFSENELNEFEQVLEFSDPALFAFVTANIRSDELIQLSMLDRICAFYQSNQ